MKKIEVVAGVIWREGKVLATQRGYGEFKDGWEFSGGKIEPGETQKEALARELFEELGVKVRVLEKICTVEADYPNFHLTLHAFYCATDETIVLKEHEAARWLGRESLNSVGWLPADVEIVKRITDRMEEFAKEFDGEI